MILTATEGVSTVTISGSGTINTGGLTFGGSIINMGSEINPASGVILNGTPWPYTADYYTGAITRPTFGTGNLTLASSGSGGLVGAPGNTTVFIVPQGYVSGTLFSTTSTYNGTLSGLGMTPGTYVWSWGSGATADTLTLNVVPEPTTALLLALGVAGLAAAGRGRSRR
jgi:hypothetical protein